VWRREGNPTGERDREWDSPAERPRQNSLEWDKPQEPGARGWEVESGTVRKDRARNAQLSGDVPARTSPRPEADPLHRRMQVMGFGPECAVATLERHVIVVWRSELTVGGVHWARKAFIHLKRTKPEGPLGLLLLAENDCDVSAGSTVRSELASLLSAHGERIAGMAVAYEGGGLRLTMLRGVATSVIIASRARVSNEVFSNVANAVTWLHARTRVPEDQVQPADLLQAANRLRLK
jgi:hypothetical protein